MKELIVGTPSVPSSHITVSENVSALTERVNNLQRRYYRSLAPDCELSTAVFFSPKVCGLKNNVHLCSDFHFEQADRAANIAVGIFYAHGSGIVPTPVWSVNAPTACSRWKSTGKRNFFCSLSRHNQHIVSF